MATLAVLRPAVADEKSSLTRAAELLGAEEFADATALLKAYLADNPKNARAKAMHKRAARGCVEAAMEREAVRDREWLGGRIHEYETALACDPANEQFQSAVDDLMREVRDLEAMAEEAHQFADQKPLRTLSDHEFARPYLEYRKKLKARFSKAAARARRSLDLRVDAAIEDGDLRAADETIDGWSRAEGESTALRRAVRRVDEAEEALKVSGRVRSALEEGNVSRAVAQARRLPSGKLPREARLALGDLDRKLASGIRAEAGLLEPKTIRAAAAAVAKVRPLALSEPGEVFDLERALTRRQTELLRAQVAANQETLARWPGVLYALSQWEDKVVPHELASRAAAAEAGLYPSAVRLSLTLPSSKLLEPWDYTEEVRAELRRLKSGAVLEEGTGWVPGQAEAWKLAIRVNGCVAEVKRLGSRAVLSEYPVEWVMRRNPEYDRAVAYYNRALANYNSTVRAVADNPYGGIAVAIAGGSLEEAESAMLRTPRSVEVPIYGPYELTAYWSEKRWSCDGTLSVNSPWGAAAETPFNASWAEEDTGLTGAMRGDRNGYQDFRPRFSDDAERTRKLSGTLVDSVAMWVDFLAADIYPAMADAGNDWRTRLEYLGIAARRGSDGARGRLMAHLDRLAAGGELDRLSDIGGLDPAESGSKGGVLALPSNRFIGPLQGVADATVEIRSTAGLGSGVVMRDGIVVTNHHVVDGDRRPDVVFADGTRRTATVLRTWKLGDLAVLAVVTPAGVRPVPFRPTTDLFIGEEVFAIGAPSHEDVGVFHRSLSRGVVSQVRPANSVPAIVRDLGGHPTCIQTDADIDHGNSGGPLVDSKGRLVGIVAWGFEPGVLDGISFAVAGDAVASFLAELD